jgi:chemotaxis protein MotB
MSEEKATSDSSQELFEEEPESDAGADEDSGGEGSPAWMATYGDMVTLLFAFFVLLYSMSSVQQESFKELVQSLKSALGVQQVPEAGTREGLQLPAPEPSELETEPEAEAVDEAGGLVQREIDEIESQVWELIMFNKLGGQVMVKGDEGGATITISDVILFPAGDARLTAGGTEIMKKIYDILAQFSYRIKVVGHTDNIPIETSRYPSNWELSANRACEVVRLLIDEGIDPGLLSAVGSGEYHPIAANDTPEGRARNRRVEIIYERQALVEKLGED